jgi:hypothetical protein
MPNVERFCTYRQCADYLCKHCPFLTAAEKDAVRVETPRSFLVCAGSARWAPIV